MPAMHTYDYAVIRVVPRVERGEFVNAGVILSCDVERVLCAAVELDETALLAIDPAVDLPMVRRGLAAMAAVCAGFDLPGELGLMTPRQRFHWLVATRSTMLQTSPVHAGRGTDLAAALQQLMDRLVRRGEMGRNPTQGSAPEDCMQTR